MDATATVFDRGADSHIYCFQGFGSVQTPFNPNPRDCGGPENSLNLWGEGNPNAVLADYGNAYSLMLYLADHYGKDLITGLHNDGKLQGLPSLEAALAAKRAGSLYGVLHNYQSMVLLDKLVGDAKHSVVLGASKKAVTTPSLRSSINFANPNINDDPGAAPNGADYVPLQDAKGKVLKGRDLRSLTFTGAKQLPPLPLAWTIVNNDPDRPGNPVLFSGNANNTDASAVTSVTVPDGRPDAALPRQVRRGVRLRLRLRAGVDRRRRHLHDDPRQQHRRRAARPRPERHDHRVRAGGVQPLRLRGPERADRHPLRQ